MRTSPAMRVLTAVAAVVAAASPAGALPGDAPVTPVAPADRATVDADPRGIAISYRCGPYTSYVDTITGTRVTKGSGAYTAAVSAAPATGADGRLADRITTTGLVPIGGDLDQCATTFGGPTAYTEPRPHRVPGTYYWQVWRECLDCPGGVEVGPVWSFTVRLAAVPVAEPPRVAFAGFPALIPVNLPDRAADVRLERRAGARWVTVGKPLPGRLGKVAGGRVPIISRLPAGRQRVRAVLTVAGVDAAGPESAVTVRAATSWPPAAPLTGSYRDPRHPSLRLRVAPSGRTISGFTAQVTASCLTPSGTSSVASRILTLPAVPVAPDGGFVLGGVFRGQSAWIQGRLTRRGVTGYAALQSGSCSGDLDFSARRVP